MGERQLETRLRKSRDVYVVDVSGEIDVSTVPQFKDAVVAASETGGDIIINLSDVTYMDSTGFGTLLSATKKLRPSGATVHLVGCNDVIERMLEITRLNTIFGMHASEDDAIASITTSPSSTAVGEAVGA